MCLSKNKLVKGCYFLRRNRRNKVKALRHVPTIYITLILMLNLMGVSYAVWTDNTNIDISLSTGFIAPRFELDESMLETDKGKLLLSLSNKDRTLNISGEVDPSFEGNVEVGISNSGSIPIVFRKLDTVSNEGEIVWNIDTPSTSRIIGDADEEDLNIYIKESVGNIASEEVSEEDTYHNYEFQYEVKFEQGVK